MSKASQQRNERTLNELRTQVEGNNVCADCRATQPRWASWNLGIFICVRCATIHRGMGSHISKVKSLTLDTWTREQVDSMKRIGNVRSNALYNPDTARNPPPLDLDEGERDSQLQRYIHDKYREKAFVRSSGGGRDNEDPPRKVSTGSSWSEMAQERTLSPPSLPLVANESAKMQVDPGNSRQSTNSTSAATAHQAVARSMTAPIPGTGAERTSSPSASNLGLNPFSRQMTASAAPIGPNTSTSDQNGMRAPMHSATMPSYFSSSLVPHAMPSLSAPVPKGEVWQDLAGLSISDTTAPAAVHSFSMTGFQQPSPSVTTRFTQLSAPSPSTATVSSKNPFLRANTSTAATSQPTSPQSYFSTSPSGGPVFSPQPFMPQAQQQLVGTMASGPGYYNTNPFLRQSSAPSLLNSGYNPQSTGAPMYSQQSEVQQPIQANGLHHGQHYQYPIMSQGQYQYQQQQQYSQY